MNRNQSDNWGVRRPPRSLIRDRPLAAPRRHLHTPLVTMSGNITQQQQRPLAANNDSQTTPPSPQSPASESSSSFLPSIDETNETKMPISQYSNSSRSESAPSLVLSCDSSDESFLEVSYHSMDTLGSDSDEVDCDDENDDDNEISCSIRSTQSMPATFRRPSALKSSISVRRRPDLPRPQRSFTMKTKPPQQYTRPSSRSAHPIPPPPPFGNESRRRSSSSVTQTYQTTTKSGASTSRRQFLAQFFLSGVFLQIMLLVAIAFLVVWSRAQAAFASDTLLRLKETESMGLLKLHRLESHSMQVHQMMRTRILRETGKGTDDFSDAEDLSQDDPLWNQYQQLSKMAHDLHKHADISSLQSTLQETAVDEIVSTYGEGPVKVVVELDFGDNTSAKRTNKNRGMAKGTYISIILWPDTPHAAWTWLEQIQRSLWDGSLINLNPTSTALQFGPTKADPKDRGHLEFVEGHAVSEKSNPDMHHGAWTVGLREAISEDHSKSNLEMFINLANNKEERKHETCIGKIFDGFDALQRLLEGIEVTPDGDANTNVGVKSVRAMHMTHHELQQIYR